MENLSGFAFLSIDMILINGATDDILKCFVGLGVLDHDALKGAIVIVLTQQAHGSILTSGFKADSLDFIPMLCTNFGHLNIVLISSNNLCKKYKSCHIFIFSSLRKASLGWIGFYSEYNQ